MNTRTRKNGKDATPTRSDEPLWRKLVILAQDPTVKHSKNKQPLLTQIDIPAEPLLPGPCGARIKVVDYDATEDRYYLPHKTGYGDADCPTDPYADVTTTEVPAMLADPRFHQQQAYAITMRILCIFERALGRRIEFQFDGHQLHVVPHAFSEANAYYSRDSRSVYLGYFPDAKGQIVHTSLSHDIIAHEMAHALLDGIRERFTEPSSFDQAAFHEGFADIVALLSVLSDQRMIEALMGRDADWRGRPQVHRARLGVDSLGQLALLGLAESMGTPLSDGRATALRRSVDATPNSDWKSDPDFEEPHQRGEVLVAAVMHGFLEYWSVRAMQLAGENAFADARRVAEEGAEAANHLLFMCIRALDYTPPTDIGFDDYLSALLTADRETMPSVPEYREIIRKSFLAWGLFPASRPRADGCWLAFDKPVSYGTIRFESLQRNRDEAFRFLWRNAKSLKVDTDIYTVVNSVRQIARVAHDGLIVRETVVDFVQILTVFGSELGELGLKKPPEMGAQQEVRLFGGGALVFDEYGRLKFSIGNNVHNTERQQARLGHLARSGYFEYVNDQAFNKGFFARLHRLQPGRDMRATRGRTR